MPVFGRALGTLRSCRCDATAPIRCARIGQVYERSAASVYTMDAAASTHIISTAPRTGTGRPSLTAGYTPADVVRWRDAGGCDELMQVLKDAARGVPVKPSDTAAARGSAVGGVRILSLEDAVGVLRDVDVCLEVGFRGGHALLTQGLAHVDEDVSAAAAECIAVCVKTLPAGWGFPMPRSLDSAYPPRLLQFEVQPSVCRCEADTGAATGGPRAGGRFMTMFRRIPASLHRMTSQDDVGQVLWPAATVLARWLMAHPTWLAGHDVLEIGAGMGVSGIVGGLAALHESAGARTRLLLTDFNELVLKNLAYNARINQVSYSDATANPYLLHVAHHDWSRYPEPSGSRRPETCEPGHATGRTGCLLQAHPEAAAAAASSEDAHGVPVAPNMCVSEFWEQACLPTSPQATSNERIPELPMTLRFDRIIGSDMICKESDAWGVAASVFVHLKETGCAMLLVAPPDVRWGVHALDGALQAYNLEFEKRQVEPEYVAPWHASSPEATDSLWADEHVTAGGYESRLVQYLVWKRAA